MEKIFMIVKLIPAVIELMKAIEEAIPGQGNGEKKLAAVRGVLESTVEGFNNLWPSIEKIIPVLVSTFNAVGIFKK